MWIEIFSFIIGGLLFLGIVYVIVKLIEDIRTKRQLRRYDKDGGNKCGKFYIPRRDEPDNIRQPNLQSIIPAPERELLQTRANIDSPNNQFSVSGTTL